MYLSILFVFRLSVSLRSWHTVTAGWSQGAAGLLPVSALQAHRCAAAGGGLDSGGGSQDVWTHWLRLPLGQVRTSCLCLPSVQAPVLPFRGPCVALLWPWSCPLVALVLPSYGPGLALLWPLCCSPMALILPSCDCSVAFRDVCHQIYSHSLGHTVTWTHLHSMETVSNAVGYNNITALFGASR